HGRYGYVGAWLLESLAWANRRLGLDVSAVVLTRNPESFQQRCPHLAVDPAITLQRGDLSTFDFQQGRFAAVVHAASGRYDRAPLPSFEHDLAATHRVLVFAGRCGAKRLPYTGSGAVYGKQSYKSASAPSTIDPGSAYEIGKRAAEYLCSGYG